jgi:hypothetical protein
MTQPGSRETHDARRVCVVSAMSEPINYTLTYSSSMGYVGGFAKASKSLRNPTNESLAPPCNAETDFAHVHWPITSLQRGSSWKCFINEFVLRHIHHSVP